jgi:hypothetical protein
MTVFASMIPSLTSSETGSYALKQICWNNPRRSKANRYKGLLYPKAIGFLREAHLRDPLQVWIHEN